MTLAPTTATPRESDPIDTSPVGHVPIEPTPEGRLIARGERRSLGGRRP